MDKRDVDAINYVLTKMRQDEEFDDWLRNHDWLTPQRPSICQSREESSKALEFNQIESWILFFCLSSWRCPSFFIFSMTFSIVRSQATAKWTAKVAGAPAKST